jgi:7-cyano-7-deazaguanine synthase
MTTKAVVLLSGGIDSTTVLAIAKRQNYQIYAISFDYGQRHWFELQAAQKIAAHFHIEKHLIMPINLRAFGGSALTADIDVPKTDHIDKIAAHIPVTYVPARNTIFLSLALGWAETLNARDIFIGANAIDYSGYPDCRPEYISAFEKMANLATKAGVEGQKITIHAPLISMTKADIIKQGIKLGVDYSMTHSCYDPSADGNACGSCDSCLLRKRGFQQANAVDPTKY